MLFSFFARQIEAVCTAVSIFKIQLTLQDSISMVWHECKKVLT